MCEKSESEHSRPFSDIRFCHLLIAVLVILILAALYGFIIYFLFNNWSDRSDFGGMFGAFGAIFTGTAFLAVMYNLMLQREAIRSQKEESIKSEKHLKDQIDSLKRQSFEQTFFNLFETTMKTGELVNIQVTGDLINKIVESDQSYYNSPLKIDKSALLEVMPLGNRIVGKDVFSKLYRLFEIICEKHNWSKLTDVVKAYEEVFVKFSRELLPWLGQVFYTLMYIHKQDFDFKDKQLYYGLIRCSLTDYQKAILLYNALALSEQMAWTPSYVEMLKDFDLFKNLDKNILIDPSHLDEFYKIENSVIS